MNIWGHLCLRHCKGMQLVHLTRLVCQYHLAVLDVVLAPRMYLKMAMMPEAVGHIVAREVASV